MPRVLLAVAPLTFLVAVGCVNGQAPSAGARDGTAGTPGAGGSAANPAAGSGGSGASLALVSSLAKPDPCTSNAPGPRKLWRLTASELAASIHSIFKDTSNEAPLATVFSDPTVLGFSIDANALLVQGLNASQLQDNAEAIATWAASANKLTDFASCAASTSGAPDAACASQFVQAFGRVAFRGTLAASDPRVATYTGLFLSGSSNSDGAQVVISAMLQSPHFLYRSELGTASGSSFTLTPAEVATEVAYTLTGTTPDSTLLAAADAVSAGSQTIAAMVDEQAARLIAANSNASSAAVMGFMDGWLGLSRLYTTAHDATVYQASASLQQAMWGESQGLILEAFNGGGTFGSALTADHSFLNQELATFYGINATGLSTTPSAVKYAGLTPRDPGLLATGTLLNGYARPATDSPTQRGHLIRSRLLCQEIAPPPAGVNTTFKPATTVETTRDHFINEHESGACAGCHKQMDWIGFAFENYDGFGRYRTTENGLPTDSTGTIYQDPAGVDAPISGLSGTGSLSAYLAQSDDVTRCMQRYWTYYTFGSSTWSQDACTYDSVYNESKSNGFTLKSTLLAIIHAASFTTRVQDR